MNRMIRAMVVAVFLALAAPAFGHIIICPVETSWSRRSPGGEARTGLSIRPMTTQPARSCTAPICTGTGAGSLSQAICRWPNTTSPALTVPIGANQTPSISESIIGGDHEIQRHGNPRWVKRLLDGGQGQAVGPRVLPSAEPMPASVWIYPIRL